MTEDAPGAIPPPEKLRRHLQPGEIEGSSSLELEV